MLLIYVCVCGIHPGTVQADIDPLSVSRDGQRGCLEFLLDVLNAHGQTCIFTFPLFALAEMGWSKATHYVNSLLGA